jgi:Uma2 family endonuclease
MTTTERLLTAEEFNCLPEPPDSGKMELVRGEVRQMAPVGAEHGDNTTTLLVPLALFVREHHLGRVWPEVGFRLSREPDTVRAPDVSFVATNRLPGGVVPRRFVDGPPTLAIEVMSPNDRAEDVQEKVEEYLSAGCERVWVVQPLTKTVTVHRPGGDAHTYHLGESLTSADAAFDVGGFALPLGELFAP